MMPELLNIVGQQEAVARLQRGLTGTRMPHAWLFAGPEGVGRRTTALALARTLLCEQPVEKTDRSLDGLPEGTPLREACGECSACRLARAGNHPDLQMVYKELAAYHEDPSVRNRKMQELGIAVIRSFLVDPAGRASAHGRGKVFIVLESELISSDAQNALLKTLEEPPPGVRIILVCQRPEQLLPTTRSRCWLVRFGLLPQEFVRDRLLADAGLNEAEADFWAAFTGGSLGRAQRLAEAGMYEVKRKLVDQLASIPPTGDAELGEQLVKTMDRLAGDEVRRVSKQTEAELAKTVASRRAGAMMLQILGSLYRDALHVSAGAELPLVHADQAQAVEQLAGRFDLTQLAEIIEQFNDYERLLRRNVNPKVVWDNVAITCTAATPLRM